MIGDKSKKIILFVSIFLGAIFLVVGIYTCVNRKKDTKSGGGDSKCSPLCDQQTENCIKGICKSIHPPTPSHDGISIDEQPNRSVQIINNTSDPYLHVFLQQRTEDEKWNYLSGDGKLHKVVDWGKAINKNGNPHTPPKPPTPWPDGWKAVAWNPLGAKITSEVIIPKGKYIIVKQPDPNFISVTMAIKMKENTDKPLKFSADAHSKVMEQQTALIEGGPNAVLDASAVDGVNYRFKLELTSKGKVLSMDMKQNPCKGLDDKYKLPVGCHNPAKVDCAQYITDKAPKSCKEILPPNTAGGDTTCYCVPGGEQDCMFNKCSQNLFDIPPELNKYEGKCDGGKDTEIYKNSKKQYPPVKDFILRVKNLKENALKSFCHNMQTDSGDFHAYCYDYNDDGSSPGLDSPYKSKITFTDLDPNFEVY